MHEKLFSKFIFEIYIQPHILAYNMADKGVISVRPPKNSTIKERLEKLAQEKERSMNYLAVKAIEDYLKKQKK